MARTPTIPGPKGFAATLLGLYRFSRDPFGSLVRSARDYGDVVLLKMPGMDWYMLNHPDDIEYILRHNPKNFKKDEFMQELRPVVGDGLLVSEGEHWRDQRKLAQPAFQGKQLQSYASTMVAYAEQTVASWQAGETRNIHRDMMRLALEIVAKTLFDADVSHQSQQVSDDLEVIMDYFANPLVMSPVFRMLPTLTNRRYRQAFPRLNSVIDEMIRQRREAGTNGRQDLLSRFLAGDEKGRRPSDADLRDEVMTLFLAGHETTALTMAFTFYLLAKHPDVEQELHAELDAVLDGRPPTADDVPRLRYTEWVIKESMRLYPPAWTIGREAIEAFEIRGYAIPAGAQILTSQWVVHRDPRFWPEPERFHPARWGDERIKELPRCAYFPFGDGPRICIGSTFAMLEAVLLLATIAQNRRLTLAPGHRFKLLPSVTLRPRGGIKMIVHDRERQSTPRAADCMAGDVLEIQA